VHATHTAMALALQALSPSPDYLLIDYLSLPDVSVPQQGLPKGDAAVLSIAAASIVAKVSRDRMTVELGGRFPGYGFERHKGYGTTLH
jgi:ribonuclease HII